MRAGILCSLLDTDLYKFTMGCAVFQLYPQAYASYNFINRESTVWPKGFANELWDQLFLLADLCLTTEELYFLRQKCPYLSPAYLDWLATYHFNPQEVLLHADKAGKDGENFSLSITGPWYRTILWEVPLMAIISELYFEMSGAQQLESTMLAKRNADKARSFATAGARFADFGTRRRFSFLNHSSVVYHMSHFASEYFIGTSNCLLAKKLHCSPVGTMAHEWIQFHAAKYGFQYANEVALDKWVEVYQGDLGIALTDTFTSEVFFRTFNKKQAKLFDGVRQDSGDPLIFADRAVAHYKALGIDPLSKTIVFSDGLNVEAVGRIQAFCEGKIKTSYGIGTNLTNDVGVSPLNMVIKMVAADDIPTVKLSDSKGKETGDPEYVALCKKMLGL